MQTTKSQAHNSPGQRRANVLRFKPEQCPVWPGRADPQHIVVPQEDDAAWEGTEIDVRRTVL